MSGKRSKGFSSAKTGAFITLASVGLFFLILWYAVSPRVTDREAALKVVRGKLVDDQVSTGVKWDALFPHVQYIQLPKFVQKITVGATERDEVTIRTKEKARIYGNFEVMYHVDNSVEDFGRIYTKWKTDDIYDLTAYIAKYTVPAAIDVYKTVETSKINDNVTELGKRIAVRLEQILADRGHEYIKVDDVLPSGVGLSGKANADLEAIVSEERKLDLLKVQGQVADQSVAITEKQAAVTAKALEKLREAGVPKEQLIQAYYLQLMRDSDSIGRQLVPGPVPGTGVGAVPVVRGLK